MSDQQPVPDFVHDATAAKLRAEAEKAAAEAEAARAEARKAHAEAAKAEHDAEVASFAAAKARLEEAKRLAGDEHHRVLRFVGAVDAAKVASTISTLNFWHRSDPGCAIEIVFFSPGGSILDGLALWDTIQDLRRSGHVVTTVSQGYAASMAGILLQAGDVRVMGRESWLMIHEASFGAGGKIGEVEDTVEWVKMIQDRILSIFASRSKLTKAQLQRRWRRKDWWISSDEALRLGLCDEVR